MINSYKTYIKQTMISTLLHKEHEFEHRRWIPEWGPKQPPEPAVGGSENWQVIMEPAPAADDPFFGQYQLQRQAGWHHAPAVGGCGQPSTIVMEVQLKDSHKLIATSKKKSYYLLEPWQSSGHI